MKIEKYHYQQTQLPNQGKHIIAQFDQNTVTVYQAFNENIANYAVQHQKFGGKAYALDRMTWIKPGFMWMMYRSGWAQKPNQERILAIDLSMEGFCTILANAVLTTFDRERYESHEHWKSELDHSEVRLQWDPDHDPTGEKLGRKAIQIGIKGNMLHQMNDQWIKGIQDITDFVITQRKYATGNFEDLDVPFERILTLKQPEIIQRIGLDV